MKVNFKENFNKNAIIKILDQDIPFIEYLKKQKLNDTLCHLIINSISMVDYNATTKQVFLSLLIFLSSKDFII
jgi:hypothetical protein